MRCTPGVSALLSILVGLSGLSLEVRAGTSPGELGPVMVLSEPPGPAAVPSAAIDDAGILHVVWSDGGSGRFDILYRSASGESRGPLARISATAGLSSGPKIVHTPDRSLFVVWHDSTPPRTRLYLQKIDRDGHPAAPASVITPETQGAFTPSIAVDTKDRLYVTWAERAEESFEIFYRAIEPDTSAGPRFNLSANPGKSLVPALATDPCDKVYVAWHDNSAGPFDVYLRVSHDGGQTFQPPVNVSSSSGLSGAPALSAPSCDTVMVFWPDATPGNFEVLGRVSVDGGRTFHPVRNFSTTASISIRPAITTDQRGTLHLTWIDGEPDRFQVFYRCITKDLMSHSPPLRVSLNRGLAGAPSITINTSGDAQIVWIENDSGTFRVFSRQVKNCHSR